VKLRYKAPDGDVSKLTSAVIADRPQPIGANLGFASAVAEAGMVLRQSPHAGQASFSAAIARARKFRGEDSEGYRAEFIRLMEVASAMPRPSTRCPGVRPSHLAQGKPVALSSERCRRRAM